MSLDYRSIRFPVKGADLDGWTDLNSPLRSVILAFDYCNTYNML
jgi:hypothetical protein